MLDHLATMWLSVFRDVALKSAFLILAVGIAAFLTRRESAATRHLVLLTGGIALLGLPMLVGTLPHWNVPIITTFAEPDGSRAAAPNSGSASELYLPLTPLLRVGFC